MLRRIYAWAAVASALCLVAILVLVCIEISGRVFNGARIALGMDTVNATVPSLAEICGYLLAAATFLALADTMARGVHIRVSLVLENLRGRARQACELLVCLVAFGAALSCAWGMGRLVIKSWYFGDVSAGLVPVPLALPQAVMFLGLGLLCVSLLDRSVAIARSRPAEISGAADPMGE
ncbi:TRAP transporter small permease subunit [Castellaniella sp. GW247-6E4]|uniref:TRAP transporter small permease n=1 Tax=Castellaniella sp. GW247-6E4 TaxID=3140380 RepID=UPI00331496B4